MKGSGLGFLGAPVAWFRASKVAENATDCSIHRTARALVWLLTSRDEKYEARQVVCGYFARIGDSISAALVFVASNVSSLEYPTIALTNAGLALAGLALAWCVGPEFEQRASEARREAEAARHRRHGKGFRSATFFAMLPA